MSTFDLDAIRQRAAAATDGPWWFDEDDDCWRLHGVHARIPADPIGIPEQIINHQILKAPKRGTTYAEYWPNAADAAFIRHSREDIPALLAEIDRLRAIIRRGHGVRCQEPTCPDFGDPDFGEATCPAEHAEPRTAAGHPAHTPGDSQ